MLAGVAPLAVAITDKLDRALADADVAIDFTLPAASLVNAAAVPRARLRAGDRHDGSRAVRNVPRSSRSQRLIPIVMAPNMSLGVNVLFKLAELAARALDESFDAEIYEAHHRNKVDAPSGTALGLGRAVAQGRGVELEDVADYARHGKTGIRKTRPHRLQRGARRRHRRRSPVDLCGCRRADRTGASRAGPLGLCARRPRGRALGRGSAAGPVLDAGRARALTRSPLGARRYASSTR